jgi:lipoate-protein ligase B
MQFNSIEVEVRRNHSDLPWTYTQLDLRQREIAVRARAGGRGALLLNEVAPVITMGRRTPCSDLVVPDGALRDRGIEVVKTDRGGLATYHGPGQWVLFVVDRLDALTGDSRGVRLVVNGLLGIAESVASEYGMKAEIRDGAMTGVWTPKGKIAAVGIHIEQGVVLHGLSFNVFRTPESFFGIRPCGLDAAVDFVCGQDCSDTDSVFKECGDRLVAAAFKRFWLN